MFRNIGKAILLSGAVLAGALPATSAEAALLIGNGATKNVSCSNGVCTATAQNAVLNAGDLASMLASSSVRVKSAAQAKDILVQAALSWTSTHRLMLNSRRSITIEGPVTVAGPGALTLTTNDGGSGGELSFADNGSVKFWDLSSSLIIDSARFTLVNTLATLASDIAADPSGHYALANEYDASADGTYSTSPVATPFAGIFNGLGNQISNVSIKDSADIVVGFFVSVGGKVVNFTLTNLQMNVSNAQDVGGLAGASGGVLRGDYVSGAINAVDGGFIGGLTGQNYCGLLDGSVSTVNVSISSTTGTGRSDVGGLVGMNNECDYGGGGIITNSRAVGTVTAQNPASAGGLVGTLIGGLVSKSFAAGDVNCAKGCRGGGLVGYMTDADHYPSVANSYALGSIVGGPGLARIGGLIGYVDAFNGYAHLINHSYSTGRVSGAGKETFVGGLIGYNVSHEVAHCYWDTDTSGANNGAGAGDLSGMTGLTTQQFQSSLPAALNPSIWGEDPNINGGYPYLIANPPPQ